MTRSITICMSALLTIGMLQAQEKLSMNIYDLEPKTQKYIKKNYKEYNTKEAFVHFPIYLVTIQKEDSTKEMAFDSRGDLLYEMTDEMRPKIAMQPHVEITEKDLAHGIKKHVDKNLEGYSIASSVLYMKVFTVKVVKEAEEITLIFDEKGEFLKQAEKKGEEPPEAKEETPAPKEPEEKK